MAKKYTEEDHLRLVAEHVADMERACRYEAERAISELNRRARSKMRELKAQINSLQSRMRVLEGNATGERLYTEPELLERVIKAEKLAYTEARAVMEEMEEHALLEIRRWRTRAIELGDTEAQEEAEREKAEDEAKEEAGEFDISKFRWSDRVLKQVLKKFDLGDKEQTMVIEAAIEFDNGDRYLNRVELERGAKAFVKNK